MGIDRSVVCLVCEHSQQRPFLLQCVSFFVSYNNVFFVIFLHTNSPLGLAFECLCKGFHLRG